MRLLPQVKLKKNGFYFIRIFKKDRYLGKDKKQAEQKARLCLQMFW